MRSKISSPVKGKRHYAGSINRFLLARKRIMAKMPPENVKKGGREKNLQELRRGQK